MRYFFITGTSSGLGKALAGELLKKENVKVIGISRRCTIEHPNYIHHTVNIADLKQLISSLPNIFSILSDADEIVLINNAGILGQIGYIGNLEDKNIEEVINTNVAAPAIMLNDFLKKYKKYPFPKVVINISSGAGKRAVDGWAFYCASKAALNMITQVANEEEKRASHKVRFYSVVPGIIDTAMQEHIRNVSPQEFSRSEEFINYKKDGKLSSPSITAEKIIYLIENKDEFTETEISVRDL
ncbi:MAG TPA: SDR family NAD(P)-dependent oxidoreductase [Cytophagaceae bacterium]|jgi:benzil reductase ((S)-benzoin forming)